MIDGNGNGEYYSFAPKYMYDDLSKAASGLSIIGLSVPGEMTKIPLDANATKAFLATGKLEGYDSKYRIKEYDISADNKKAIYDKTMDIYFRQPNYRVSGGQCDNKVSEILQAGGIDYVTDFSPNLSFENAPSPKSTAAP